LLKIPTRARYSIRLMSYLADHALPDQPVKLKSVANSQNLSLRYLEQLVVHLKGAGLVKSKSGKRGGYYLARDAKDISVGQVVEAAVGPVRVMDCLDSEDNCRYKEVCAARRMWGLVSVRISDVLYEYTIADMSEQKMRDQLGAGDAGEEAEPLRC
jgi:Rrf2 family cysteine metabolism transcriptional repressor